MAVFGGSHKRRIGALIRASRSSIPSCTVATAKYSAPEFSAVFATRTAPWPYASALTTAHKRQLYPIWFLLTRTLLRIAFKSISSHDQRLSIGSISASLSGSNVKCPSASCADASSLCGSRALDMVFFLAKPVKPFMSSSTGFPFWSCFSLVHGL